MPTIGIRRILSLEVPTTGPNDHYCVGFRNIKPQNPKILVTSEALWAEDLNQSSQIHPHDVLSN